MSAYTILPKLALMFLHVQASWPQWPSGPASCSLGFLTTPLLDQSSVAPSSWQGTPSGCSMQTPVFSQSSGDHSWSSILRRVLWSRGSQTWSSSTNCTGWLCSLWLPWLTSCSPLVTLQKGVFLQTHTREGSVFSWRLILQLTMNGRSTRCSPSHCVVWL